MIKWIEKRLNHIDNNVGDHIAVGLVWFYDSYPGLCLRAVINKSNLIGANFLFYSKIIGPNQLRAFSRIGY